MDGSTLLFFRDPAASLAIGAEALLEIAFDNSEDTWVVRAKVVVRAEGQGLWLAVPTARFAREELEGDLVERKGRRLGADKVVRLHRQSGTQHLVMLADLSLGGARISGVPPESAPGALARRAGNPAPRPLLQRREAARPAAAAAAKREQARTLAGLARGRR